MFHAKWLDGILMPSMTQRERFLKYMTFQSVDRIPLMEMGLWPETLERWHQEGLSERVTDLRGLEKFLGLDVSFNLNWLSIDDNIHPAFPEKIIEETENAQIVSDRLGVVYRWMKEGRSIPQYIRFPVEDEDDYEKLRPRLDGSSPSRYPSDFEQDLKLRQEKGEVIGLNFRSFFGFPRGLMGFKNWCLAFYDQPSLVEKIMADRLQFAKQLYARVLQTGLLDFVQVWEDMSYKTAPMISPQFVRKYMLPLYEELVNYFRKGGVQVIMVDTDGRVQELLPLFLEAGMDGTHPCEIAAGSDPLELRRQWPRAALMGGMDKRAIAAGREGVDAELERVKPLLAEGGYIPMLDHFVPPNVSYETYLYYVEARRKALNQGAV